jgi:23S rRNA pseudouridine1911/1915/1917 synthase
MGSDGRDDTRWIRHTVTADEAGRTIQSILKETLEISGRMIQRLTRSRGIRVNGRPPRLSATARAGDRVEVRIAAAERSSLAPVEMPLSIVHEDEDVLVIDKPAGLLVHPVNRSGVPTLAHGVAHHFSRTGSDSRVRPLHRLDRDTSGLVVFARTAFAQQRLDRQLRDGGFRRSYLAFVEGEVREEAGRIDAPIGPRPGQPHLRAVDPAGDAALTRFRLIARSGALSLLDVELETGRTHQIRVHMAYLGHPLAGDRQYGARAGHGLRRQALHAYRVSFTHPSGGEPQHFESPLPAELRGLAARLDVGDSPGSGSDVPS